MKLKFCWEERSGCFLFFLFLNTKPTASITEAAMGKWDVNTIMKTNFSFFAQILTGSLTPMRRITYANQ